jgi:hypothetical protein
LAGPWQAWQWRCPTAYSSAERSRVGGGGEWPHPLPVVRLMSVAGRRVLSPTSIRHEGGRARPRRWAHGTAVVSLVGVQLGLSARRVRRERRGPDYQAQERERGCGPSRGSCARFSWHTRRGTSGGTQSHTDQQHHGSSSAPTREGVRVLLRGERLWGRTYVQVRDGVDKKQKPISSHTKCRKSASCVTVDFVLSLCSRKDLPH